MYKQFQTKFLALLAIMLMGVGSAWAQTETVYYTLNPQTGSNNSYASSCDISIDGITWNVTGNAQMIPWRIGGKSITNTNRTVYSKTAMGSPISKVALTVGAASSITVNSLKLTVASDANFNNQIDEVTATFTANSTINFTPTSGTEWASGAYYKFTFNVTVSGSSNKFVEFSKAEFYKLSNGEEPTPTVAAPTFSPAAGEVAYGTEVTVSQENDYLITYTTDGTEPTYDSPTFNSNKPIVITGETTVKAIAFGNNDQNNPSSVATATYTVIHPNAPTFNPAAGAVAAGTQITIIAEQGYRIMYTINGTDPSYQSNIGEIYDAPITINEAMTIKAIAVNIVDPSKNIGLESPVAEATYTIRQAISGYNVDFESELDLYTDWTFTNAVRTETGTIEAHGGDFYASTGGKESALFQTKTAVAYPGTFTCYVSKQTNNTTSSTWKIQVSANGTSWTDVASQDATSMTKGEWVEFSANLSSYTNVFVRLSYSGSTAVRAVDDISLTTYVPEPHTVTLADDNSTLTEETASAGVTLPSRNAIGDYTFAGWSDTNVADETTTAPTIVAAGTYHPTANVTLYPVYTRTEGSATTETATVSISDYATANNWSNSTQYESVTIDSNVTATANGGGNTGKYYTNGNNWRFYQNENAKVTITTTSGTLNSVKFTFAVSNTGTLNYNGSALTSGEAVNVSGTSAEFTVGNSGSATNGQVQITAIEVTYTAGNSTTYYWSNPGATVSISSAGLATFCSEYALDFTGVADVWAYIAKYENDKVTYQRVKKVPANTGVLLRNKLEEAAISCVVPFLAINTDDVTGNMFIGTLEDINALPSVDGQNTNYILNNGANGVGFYKANDKKVGAGKAYLQLPTNAAKTFIGFDEEGEATSISTIDNGQLTMDNAYNLQGQKVGSEYKGIVIVNGKKVMVK